MRYFPLVLPVTIMASLAFTAEPRTDPAKDAATASKLATDNANFAFDLLRAVARDQGNIFLSPQSVSTALAMTAAGADGSTADELTRVLRWSTTGVDRDHAFGALTRALTPPPKDATDGTYEWTEANRLWIAGDIRDSFASRLKTSFGADLGRLEGKPASDAALINAWTSDQTRKRITKLVSDRDVTDVEFVLTNAVFFKGEWRTPFSKSSTAPRDFHLATGATITPPTMAAMRGVLYAKSADFAAISMPYRGGVSFLAILPDEGKFEQVGAALTGETFVGIVKTLASKTVDVQIPKLKFQVRRALSEPLQALGAAESFSNAARFPAISPKPLKISDVIHVADIELDEKGVEAAATTAVLPAPGAARPAQEEPPKPVFHADRPFFIVIRHDETGAILFLGRVSDPR